MCQCGLPSIYVISCTCTDLAIIMWEQCYSELNGIGYFTISAGVLLWKSPSPQSYRSLFKTISSISQIRLYLHGWIQEGCSLKCISEIAGILVNAIIDVLPSCFTIWGIRAIFNPVNSGVLGIGNYRAFSKSQTSSLRPEFIAGAEEKQDLPWFSRQCLI